MTLPETQKLNAALNALYLEVPSAVAGSVYDIANKAIKAERTATLAECLKVVEEERDKAQQNMLEFHRLGLNAARDAASEVTAYQRIASRLREIGKGE
jgi:hypothetical protein